jgi:citrate lyase subunit beta/citryl-CoA lyase
VSSPRTVLFGASDTRPLLPVCDHYAGVEPRMRKSLQLQAEMGPVFDVTLDNEDGAPVGGETDQAHLIASLLGGPDNCHGRVGVRLLPVDHARFAEVAAIVLAAGRPPAYLMLPKPDGLADVERAARALDALGGSAIPLHALIETHGALAEVFAIAAHPRIESLSFGLMDFVSAHRGAIPRSAMGMAGPLGQFDHPLVVRAKLEIAAACHAHRRTPAHGVVTEFKDLEALRVAAALACQRMGYTRMWSIHPAQIQPIVDAFAPAPEEVETALEIIVAAEAANWAPIRHRDTLHDRASYRYFWHVIERAEATAGAAHSLLPAALRQAWFG